MTLKRFFVEMRLVSYQVSKEREAQANLTALKLAEIMSKTMPML